MRATRAIINSDALRHNVAMVRRLAPDSKIMAVIKANAYGHGLVEVASVLRGQVEGFGVACKEEAMVLREHGVDGDITLLEGLFVAAELKTISRLGLRVVIHSHYQIDAIEIFAAKTPLRVWLKLDSGMHRLGFEADTFATVYQRLLELPQVAKPIGLMTHFANADRPDLLDTCNQLSCFKKCVDGMEGPRTLANSAAILAWPETHFDWVRPGLLLFGCSPLGTTTGTEHGLIPAMSLESDLIAVRELKSGQSIGYGSNWQAAKDTRIGIIAIGYGDGYPRRAVNGTPVWLNGRTVPLVGCVSMDMITVDLGQDSVDAIGERAVLWGPELPVEVVARHAQTIPYELLCGISRRVDFQHR